MDDTIKKIKNICDSLNSNNIKLKIENNELK